MRFVVGFITLCALCGKAVTRKTRKSDFQVKQEVNYQNLGHIHKIGVEV